MSEQTGPGADSGDEKPETPKLPPRITVKQTVGRVEGGEVTAVKIGQLVIYLPPLSWLIPIAILVPTMVVAAILLYPRFAGPGRMKHQLNIAIADFGELNERGEVRASPVAAQLSDTIFYQLSAQIEATPTLKGLVDVQHAGIGFLTDADAAARAADRLNAHLVVFGALAVRGGDKALLPKFFVRGLSGADELTGPSQLGRPVRFSGPLTTADTLEARSHALTLIAIGLTYWAEHDYGRAIDHFNQAIAQEKSVDPEGEEILFLFLGTAYKNRAVATKNAGDLALARSAYTATLGINQQSARAHLGLGNTYYEEYRIQYNTDHERADRSKLDLAATEYISATQAADRPPAAHIDAKAHFSLGNVYVAQAQAGKPGLYADAEKAFQQVIDEYQRDACNTQLRAVAARAYCGLGIVNERGTKDYAAAYQFYQQCRDNAGDDQELLNVANTQQPVVRQLMGPSARALPTASATVAPACASQPAKWPCTGGLFGLGVVLAALSRFRRIQRR